ncbi:MULTISPECIES: heme ABC exporter ATP-binding protein CcmA [unclassified Rudaea]|uniref:heme ABC exporter ATP-binding protein CcmA n=1 Tax=unclassified Rudaea TaxID=2627037 RepID=UPI002016732C|nr:MULTISPECIES: heme ABC exporter ATP-binding protein CcmA [unclassified Rudaea]
MPAIDLVDTPPLLAAHCLAYARNEEPIFGPLDFSLAAGEVVLIEGDNGSGKTTLLKVLSGLLEPTSGEVLLNGVHLTLAKLSHQVALLGHLAGIKMELSTLQNLRFAVGLGGIRPGITPPLALASVGLAGYEDQPVRLLSAGQKKRVALARLLLVPAALWLLDEPYANLDREGIELVNRLLTTHAQRGGAALITSHGAYAYTSGTPRKIALNPGTGNRESAIGPKSTPTKDASA